MTVYYTSDLHLGHRRVSEIRGFGDVEEHDAAVADGWKSVVRPDDTVYVLGDVAMGGFDAALAKIRALPGTKRLIAGNHDPVHPMHRTAPREIQRERWTSTFESIQPFARRRVAGIEFLLSHFPYAEWGDGPERGEARHLQYRLPDLGGLLLHGHTHGRERLHGRELHVGVDAWGFVPVSDEIVTEHLRAAS
ncbi:metallophosphoesterase family protein [Herbiconiux moechotypicola]|uniref:Metallophosphoesterase family protein n=1 Tax=Herbiconiux moechotypicola TaxID=637393 RepID=A0ABN3DGD2_9MICO|nr:metallophosphoesterase family protein [Herbiconiux moechotypicola]MCS5729515.1 metallophosphoesterase family protein [Herbiconiux moechotypicola]